MLHLRRGRPLTASLAAVVLLLACGHAGAQAQAPQTVSEVTATVNGLLRSDDATEVAWGAFTASQHRVVSAIPLLTDAVGRELGADADSRRATELAILDALVQLDAHVPVDVLRPSFSRWPIPSLILLNNASGDRDAFLLERLNGRGNFEWQAMANLLLESKPPGFAFRLLEDLQLRLIIYVTDDPGRGFGNASGSAVENDSSETIGPSGFPPLAEYQFALARPGATIMSTGPQTVYYARRMRSPGVIPQPGSLPAKPSAVDRVQYLNALVKERFASAPLRATTSETLVWANPEAFRRDIAARRNDIAGLYQRIVSFLVSTKHLSEDEGRTFSPQIAIAIEDRRSDKGEPLPAVDEPGTAVVRSPRPGPIRKIHDARPIWPEAAQRADVRGTVVVEFTIATDGSVTEARILRGIPLLDEAAIDCVRQWRYAPVLLEGRPIPTHMTAAVSFP
jgi:TonB family protein